MAVRFESSDEALDVVVGAEVIISFDAVGGIAIVVVLSSVMLSLVVVGGTEEDGVVGEVRG